MQNTVQQIRASAGSGKTHTIINTFLKHLSANQDNIEEVFSSILAITFTNAAAADMKSKLIARLKDIALEDKQEDTSIQFSKNEAIKSIEAFIKHYTALNIRTIDSFLFMLLKQNSIDLHLPPEFEPLFKTDEFFIPLLDELAFVSLHKNTNPQSDEAKILKPYYEKMYETLYKSANKKGFLGLSNVRYKLLEVCDLLSHMPNTSIAKLSNEEDIAVKYSLKMQEYSKIITQIKEIVEKHKIKEKKDYRDGMASFANNGKVVKAFSGQAEEVIDRLFYATAIKALAKTEEGIKLLKVLGAHFEDLEALYENAYLYENALIYAPLLPLAKIILEMQAYEEFNKGKILSTRILALLHTLIHSEDSHLPRMLERLPFQLESVLIDEFQDTSTSQWELIRPFSEEVLSRGGAFTYVGDVKQAIYSWRGGNSRLFEGILEEFKVEIQKIKLETNWRSSPRVVEFNNLVFSQFKDIEFSREIGSLTGKSSLIEPDFSHTLVDLFKDVEQAIAPKYSKNKEEGRVLLHRLVPENYIGNAALYEELRPKLCSMIKLRNSEFDYGEMAILVRKNTDCNLIANWLTAEGIPVITEGALNIASNFLVSQCISLLEYLKDSENEIALWHIIGFEGLFTEEDLVPMDLWLEAKKSKKDILMHLKDTKIYPKLMEFIEAKKTMNVYALLSQMVEKFDLFNRFPSQSGFVARLLELSLKAESKGLYSLSSFLDYWHNEGQEEQIPMPDGINAVRIMTIHKSKGAEFNLVFVFDRGKLGDVSGLKHYERENLLFLSNHSVYHEDYKEDTKIMAVEAINLLYVAFTRAKKELHLLYIGTKNDDSILEKMLRNPIKETMISEIGNFDIYGKDIVKENSREEEIAKEFNILPVFNHTMPRLNFSELEESEIHVLTPAKRGNLVHKCLEHYFKFAKVHKECDKGIVPMLLSSENIDKKDRLELEKEISSYFDWLKSQENFDIWCENAFTEQSIVDKDNKAYRCDMYYIHDNIVHIIDFKTGEEREKYHEQIQHYAHLLKHIDKYKSMEFQGFLVYLDNKKIVQVNCKGQI